MPRHECREGKQEVKWKLAGLKDHPKQRAMFGDVAEEIADLAADMRKNGLKVPVEVLPDGTIVCGHQRVRAARMLGWDEIDVVVRADLADEAAVEECFIADNLNRRHLTPLARARCIARLLQIESRGGRSSKLREQTKEQIARRLNLSARSVNRYLLVLEAPEAVQHAFDRGGLTLVRAGKLGMLGHYDKRRFSKRVEAGEDVLALVDEYLGGRGPAEEITRAYKRLLGAIQREAPALDGRAGELSPGQVRALLPAVRQAQGVLARLAVGITPKENKRWQTTPKTSAG
jgi:ParB/RepB/Spo0J family partition protein